MTTSVSPPLSSKVTVVTAPPSSPSSFVQTRRDGGVTSTYLPKNDIGCSDEGWLNTKRYVPPVRTSVSQERKEIPHDFGTHHRLSSSGLVQALKTICAGPLKVRVATSSRSDFRSTVVGYVVELISLFFLLSMGFLLLF